MNRNALIISLTTLVLLSVLFIGIRLHYSSKREVVSRFQEQQLLLAHHIAKQIESFFWGHSRGLYALPMSNLSQDKGLKHLQLDLQTYAKKMDKNYVSKVSLYDKAGAIIYSTDSWPINAADGESDFLVWAKDRRNKGAVFVSPITSRGRRIERERSQDSGAQECTFLLAMPLYYGVTERGDPGQEDIFAGTLALTVDLGEFIFREFDDVVDPRNTWIIEKSGRFLLVPQHPELALRSTFQSDNSCTHCHDSFDWLDTVRKEETGSIAYKVNASWKLAVFQPMKFENASWIIVLDSEDARVTTFVNRNLREHLILFGIAAFAIVLSSLIIHRNYRTGIRATEEARHLEERLRERKQAEATLKESEERLRFLSSQLLTAQEKERGRISRELHDELGQALATVKLRIRLVKNMAHEEQADLKQECEQTLSFLDQVIEDVRRLSRDMSPSVLEHFGLSTALRRLLGDFAKDYNIQLTLDMTEIDPFFTLDAQTGIYRIFQETLNNTGKHAGARSFSVAIKKEDGAISFTLEDDGRGFDMHAVAMRDVHRKGLGLDILEERVRMLGGVLNVLSREGKGTRITFSIPIVEKGGA